MNDFRAVLIALRSSEVEFVIIGGVAGVIHGSSYITNDLDICYARNKRNLEKISKCFEPLHTKLRGISEAIPFVLDTNTLKNGMNFTLTTNIGNVDLFGEVEGIGDYKKVSKAAIKIKLFGAEYLVLSLKNLIKAKQAVGRPKDKLILPELKALLEATKKRNKS
ncbi:MAG TPA: hypothetical protein VMT35_10835 [Ignavibacteriaceae bacterium]|nr:hypothetical protein [Ignavibacteriaceae bacterium]